ncbi:MAG TPA: MFS transporter [Luteibaculaceae bacterium]|nr:MFS transporter [Luteibaculaceae bacterium]
MTAEAPNKKVARAWIMYDWANSVYPLVINSTIFPIYYESITATKDANGNVINDMVSFMGFEVRNVALYSYALSVSYLLVAIITPLLSGIADYSGTKKRFLKIFCYLGAISCLLFTTFSADQLEWGMLLVMLASIGFSGGLVFYNAFLPEIAAPQYHDQLSARGFSNGYAGSVILLLVNLVLVLSPNTFGIPDTGTATKIAFATVGLWWMGFAQFTFVGLPEERKITHSKQGILTKGYKELRSVWREMKQNLQLKRYLGSFFIYNMGVQTVMILAATFAAKEVKQIDEAGNIVAMSSDKLIISILLIQLVAIPGSFFFSKFSGWFGNKASLLLALLIWIGVCIGAYFVVYDTQFFVVAAVVGLIMGGIQSMSRSTYSKLMPETADHASYFSFYDVADKLGIVLGTFAYGFIFDVTGSMRNSIVAIVAFFMLGAILLMRVPSDKKIAARTNS